MITRNEDNTPRGDMSPRDPNEPKVTRFFPKRVNYVDRGHVVTTYGPGLIEVPERVANDPWIQAQGVREMKVGQPHPPMGLTAPPGSHAAAVAFSSSGVYDAANVPASRVNDAGIVDPQMPDDDGSFEGLRKHAALAGFPENPGAIVGNGDMPPTNPGLITAANDPAQLGGAQGEGVNRANARQLDTDPQTGSRPGDKSSTMVQGAGGVPVPGGPDGLPLDPKDRKALEDEQAEVRRKMAKDAGK